jgi:hypothetical protein
MRKQKTLLAFVALTWAGLGAPGVAHAALQISVCGHSTYECEKGSDPNTGWGDQTPIGSEVQASQICNADKTKCLTVPNNPNNLGPTPAGWSSPTQPPTTTTQQAGWAATHGAGCPSNNCEKQSSAIQACIQAHPNHTGHNLTNFVASPPSPWPYGHWQCRNGSAQFLSDINSFQVCPNGYSVSGSTCALSNASLVQKPTDGKCTVLRSGNTFSGDANDPDCSVSTADSPAQQLNLGGSGSASINAAKDGYSGSVSNNTTDGSTTITFSVPNYTNGTTTTFTLKLGAPDGTGKQVVTGIGKATGSGIGTGADPNAQPDPQPSCGVAGKPPCTMKIDETGTPTDSTLSAQKSEFETKNAERITATQNAVTVSNLGLGLSITWPTGSCSDLSFSMPRGAGTLTVPWCERHADIKSAVGYLVAIVTAFGLFSIGIGALRST